MHVLIIGGAGMIGRKLAERLAKDGGLGRQPVSRMTLYDVVEPLAPSAPFPVDCLSGDLSSPGETDRLMEGKPEYVFHLAAIVSGEAETDFDKGYRINLDGTRLLLVSIREAGHVPRLVFTSSIAVFGAPFPDKIPDDFHLTPLTSYGAQKACDEFLLADFTRKGLVDGIGLRLPTICVRPGKPNLAASSFFSGILREPLAGVKAICPVDPDVRHWMASPQAAVGFLIHAAEIDGDTVGPRRNLTMPGISITVGEMVEALERVAGSKVAARVKREPDDFIKTIVSGWPRDFEPVRALELGFTADPDIDSIIRSHIDAELGGVIA